MGSEILDSSRGSRTVAPELVDPQQTAPVLELDELTPLSPPTAPTSGPGPRRGSPLPLRRAVSRLRHDAQARRATLRTVVICLVLMALTAFLVQYRATRQLDAERAGRLAVDLRLTSVRPSDDAVSNGSVLADLQVHNLSPAAVKVVALDVMNGGDASDVVIANSVERSSAPVDPGLTRETTYTINLPCRPSFQLGFGPPQLIAKVRTSDGALHSTPVNLDSVNEQGGLLTACVQDSAGGAIYNFGSASNGRSVTWTITVNSQPQLVSLDVPDVGVPVQLLTTPRLPVLARPGQTLDVTVTPRVTGCPRTGLDMDTMQNFGVTIGTEQIVDSYLPLLVAQAVGRACARR